jgi:hypothetical protein
METYEVQELDKFTIKLRINFAPLWLTSNRIVPRKIKI